MVGGGGFVAVVFVVFGVGLPILLYVLVRAEHDNRETMDRETAERVARRDESDDP